MLKLHNSCHFLSYGHTKKQNLTKGKKREQARDKTCILTLKRKYSLRECTDEFSLIWMMITESIVLLFRKFEYQTEEIHFLSGLGCNGLMFAQPIPTVSPE
jgi:hypothetical protein